MDEHNESSNYRNKSLIEQYADAQTDLQVLNMILKGYTDDPQTIGLGVDQTILRSIRRSEEDMERIRAQYEQEGLR